MKRVAQMLKRSPAAGPKCSRSLQSKPVSPNAISGSETEDAALPEDPCDDGKSVYIAYTYHSVHEPF